MKTVDRCVHAAEILLDRTQSSSNEYLQTHQRRNVSRQSENGALPHGSQPGGHSATHISIALSSHHPCESGRTVTGFRNGIMLRSLAPTCSSAQSCSCARVARNQGRPFAFS